jgi:hypothetical protein
MCVNPETHEWNYWMDRPPLDARNLITLNVPGDIEELKKEAGDPKGGWRRMRFSPSLAKELVAMQAGRAEGSQEGG